MGRSRRMSLGSLCVAALTLCMALSGCGATSTTRTGQGAAASAATAAATATPLPTETTAPVTAAEVESAGCPSLNSAPTQPRYITVGGLSVSTPQRILDYPSELMPTNEPNAPYQIAASAVTNYAPNPPVNPMLSMGYLVHICNETSASHALTSMTVNIASFSARSGSIAVWHICGDGPYDAATKQTTSGCGGAIGGVTRLAATLPNDSVGASAPVTGLIWPAMIGPNKSLSLVIAVNGLNSQGMYALTLAVSVDGAAPAQVATSDGPFLMAPSATVWTGTTCQTAAMQAHILSSSQDTYYVCPPTS